MSDPGKKYLIVGPSWVGDMVMAQCLFHALKQRNVDCQIDVLAPAWTAALIDRMPEVRRLVPADFQHGKLSIGERIKLGRELRAEGYEQAIVLPNSLKSALVPWLAGVSTRTGFVGEMRYGLLNDHRKLDKSRLPMTVQRFISLGLDPSAAPVAINDITAPKLSSDRDQQWQLRKAHGLDDQRPLLALCPGAEFGSSKKWPAQHYAELVRYYSSEGWQVLLLGSANDIDDCAAINDACENLALSLAGETELTEAIDLIACCNLVISNDSGLMHIAAALQVPLVAIYGSTDPGHTPPLSHNHSIAKIEIDCSPCFERQCPLSHHRCMQDLLPAQVIELAGSLR
ncbi:MAG: lipopolysaccharide heptosyltransferase II [Gammaproteobacteria bacterium]|nr:lipopolysaccharide heptosyltransferase II [Gammaproteobacteria bacterium]